MKKVICLMLSFFLISTAGCTAQNSASSAGTKAQPGTASSAQVANFESSNKTEQTNSFSKIDMVTVDSGYAITKDFRVLKTTDGGKNWTRLLTIDDSSGFSDGPALFVRDDKTVFVAFDTVSGIEVQKSMDSGKSWSESMIKMQTDDPNTDYGGGLAMSFVNPSDGFLLTSSLPAAGQMGKALYKTLDGGKSWTLAGESLANINGYTTGMTFSDASTSYITCTYHGQKEISVYRTKDGGKSWATASLPLPEKYTSLSYGNGYYVDAYSPAFEGKDRKSAKIQLYFCHNEEHSAYLYSSDDAGATWNIVGVSNLLMADYCFVDANNGFGIDENGILYVTDNGGITWQELS